MDLELKEKIIIISGGAKGIGAAISTVLAQENAIPVIIGRNEKDNIRQVEHIKALGKKADYITAELTIPEACREAVNIIVKKHGTIHALVNNAGVNDNIGLEHGTYEGFMESYSKNVVHYYMLAKQALPELIKNQGSILNIGSKVADTGQGNTSGYAAANGARNALTREWAVELLKYRIRVNALIVAECFTPLYEDWIKRFEDPQEKLKTITDKIPLGKRMTSPEEIANMAAFLVSPLSSHTTGQLVYVDGGYVHLDRALE